MYSARTRKETQESIMVGGTMTEHICDRCKRPTGKTWYTIEMYGHNDGLMGTVDSMTQNLSQIMQKGGASKRIL